jgi:hypothetical protein
MESEIASTQPKRPRIDAFPRPDLSVMSDGRENTKAEFKPNSPGFSSTSSVYSPISPHYSPTSPKWSSASPEPGRRPEGEDDLTASGELQIQQMRDQQKGEAEARQILGEFYNAPTVAFFMPQAYQLRPVEWQVIRGILEEDEKARVDLQHLSQVLEIQNLIY